MTDHETKRLVALVKMVDQCLGRCEDEVDSRSMSAGEHTIEACGVWPHAGCHPAIPAMDGSGQEIHRSKQDRLRALRETHRLRKLQWMGFAEFFIGPTAGRTRWVYSGQAYVSQAYVSQALS